MKRLWFGGVLIVILGGVTANAELSAQEAKAEREFQFARKLFDDELYLLSAEQMADFGKRFPDDEKADDAWYLAGESYFKIGEYKSAFTALKEVEIGYPRSKYLPQARFRMAESRAALGDHEAAAELFRRVSGFHPDHELAAKALLHAGRAFNRAGETNQALSVLSELVNSYQNSPERSEGYLEIVRIYLQQKKYDNAVAQIDAILQVYGPENTDPRAFLLRGEIFERMGHFDEAQKQYEKTVQKAKGTDVARQAFYRLGVIFQKKGFLDNALSNYEQAMQSSQTPELSDELHYRIGEIRLKQKNYEGALQSFQQMKAEGDPERQLARDYHIALCLAELERYFLAESKLREIISNATTEYSNPLAIEHVTGAYQALIEVLVKLDRAAEALNVSESYQYRFGERANTRKLAALKFREAEIAEAYLQKHSQALRRYDEFIELFPRDEKVDEAQIALGRCYEKLGDYRMALREYQRYLAQFPGGDNYDLVRDKIELIEDTVANDESVDLRSITTLIDLNSKHDGRDLQFEIGKVLLQAKKFQDAIGRFRKAASAEGEPLRNEILSYLGQSYYSLGRKFKLLQRDEEAEARFDSAAVSLKFLVQKSENPGVIQHAQYLLNRIELDALDENDRITKLRKLTTAQDLAKNPYGDFYLIRFMRALSDSSETADVLAQVIGQAEVLLQNFPNSEHIPEAYFHRAAATYFMQPDSVALRRLTQFVQSYPGSHFRPEALLYRAHIKKKLDDAKGAMEDLNSLVSDYFYSKFANQARVELAEIEVEAGQLQSALDLYRELQNDLQFSATNGGFHASEFNFQIGQIYEKMAQPNQALASYIDFIEESGSGVKRNAAVLAVARIAKAEGNLQFATEYYSSILNHDTSPDLYYEAHIALGDIYFENKNFGEARQHYLSAVGLSQLASEQRYPKSQAIRSLYKQKQVAAAESQAKEFEKQFDDTDREEAQFLLDQGNAYLSEKKFEPAEKAFKKLRSDYKKTELAAHGEFGLGKVYLITNHTEDALKILTDIPSKYPQSEVTPLAYLNLGDFYYKSQQVQNAIEAFRKVLEHPKAGEHHKSALLYLVQCYRDVGFWDMAIARTREFLQTYPTSEQSFRKKIDLAFFLMQLREYDRAIKEFQLLLPLADSESEAEIQFYIAQSYNEMGNFHRATAEYLKVKYLTKPSKLPWHVTALFEAGRCLLRLDENEQARKIFERIVKEQGSQSNFGRFALQKLEEMETASK